MGFSTRSNKISAATTAARIERSKRDKLKRVEAYYINPKLCKQCSTPIDYEKKRDSDFCSRTCSGKRNGTLRVPSEQQRLKTSEALKGCKRPNSIAPQIRNPPSFCKVFFRNCTICSKPFYVRYQSASRKTCSRNCQTHASVGTRPYQNGSKKAIRRWNKFQSREIYLESSWEVKVADLLDAKNIEWHRPEPIRWEDRTGKSHLYYPDFYIPEKNFYLDPKNPWCMERDAEKMFAISKQIDILYGGLDLIQGYINSL